MAALYQVAGWPRIITPLTPCQSHRKLPAKGSALNELKYMFVVVFCCCLLGNGCIVSSCLLASDKYTINPLPATQTNSSKTPSTERVKSTCLMLLFQSCFLVEVLRNGCIVSSCWVARDKYYPTMSWIYNDPEEMQFMDCYMSIPKQPVSMKY